MDRPTYILRHRKENKKKCTLTFLEKREGFIFLDYPNDKFIDLSSTLLLTLDAPILTKEDCDRSLFLLDGTWKLALKMEKKILSLFPNIEKRSLPPYLKTAYPRVQTGCSKPQEGLASIEALFAAFSILGRENSFLFEHYYWKDLFLSKNSI